MSYCYIFLINNTNVYTLKMIWFFALALSQDPDCIDIQLPADKRLYNLEEEVIERQICKGFFQHKKFSNCRVSVQIIGSRSAIPCYSSSLSDLSQKTHFSFNMDQKDTYTIQINIIPIDESKPYTPGVLSYSFETDFDTFNKDIAKDVRYEPAVDALTGMERLLHELTIQTETRATKLKQLTTEHTRCVKYVVLLNFFGLAVVIFINCSQVFAAKNYLKKKKIL